MAVVTTPAYPEATALQLVAEQENREDDTDMDESQKKIAELETRLKLAEQKSENDEEMRKKDEEMRGKEEELEQAKADKAKAEADLTAAQNTIAEKDTTIAEKDSVIAERDAAIVVKDARIAELEAQVAELEPFKARVEALEAEKAAAELTAKQTELTHFAEAQGLDIKAEAVANAIQNVAPAEGKVFHGHRRPAGAQNEGYFHCRWGGANAPGEINEWLVSWPQAFIWNTAAFLRVHPELSME